jgi:hypothetical protein
MKNVSESVDVFRVHLDPLKADVAELGAFLGLMGRSKTDGADRVRKLASAALAKAGLAEPASLAAAARRWEAVRGAQASVADRVRLAYRRFVGVAPYSSRRPVRAAIEGVFDLLGFFLLPPVVALIFPFTALFHWLHSRAEHREGAVARLLKAAEEYLSLEFEWHFEKGKAAREVRRRREGKED